MQGGRRFGRRFGRAVRRHRVLLGGLQQREAGDERTILLGGEGFEGLGFKFPKRRRDLGLLGSRVAGSEEAILRTQKASARYYQRPDNDYESVDPNRTTLSGHAGSLRRGGVSRTPGRGRPS